MVRLSGPKTCHGNVFRRSLSGRATLRRPDLRRITVSKALYSLLRSGGENAVRRFYRLTLSGLGFLLILAAALGQRSVASTDKPTAIGTGNLELRQRKELPSEAVSAEGLIRLDATVTDQAGKAVAGLQRTDFRLLDNSQAAEDHCFPRVKGSFCQRGGFAYGHYSPGYLGFALVPCGLRAATGGAIPALQIREAGAASDHLLAGRFGIFPYCEVVDGRRSTCHGCYFR